MDESTTPKCPDADLGHTAKYEHLNVTRRTRHCGLYILLATESYTLSSAKCSEVEELKRVQKRTGCTVAEASSLAHGATGQPWSTLSLSREVEYSTLAYLPSSDTIFSHAHIESHTHSWQLTTVLPLQRQHAWPHSDFQSKFWIVPQLFSGRCKTGWLFSGPLLSPGF